MVLTVLEEDSEIQRERRKEGKDINESQAALPVRETFLFMKRVCSLKGRCSKVLLGCSHKAVVLI